jgi:hypothetical protein
MLVHAHICTHILAYANACSLDHNTNVHLQAVNVERSGSPTSFASFVWKFTGGSVQVGCELFVYRRLCAGRVWVVCLQEALCRYSLYGHAIHHVFSPYKLLDDLNRRIPDDLNLACEWHRHDLQLYIHVNPCLCAHILHMNTQAVNVSDQAAYTHTYINTYIHKTHTYILYIHAYIHTYIHKTHTCILYIYTYTHTQIHKWTHTYAHPHKIYAHTRTYTHIHASSSTLYTHIHTSFAGCSRRP